MTGFDRSTKTSPHYYDPRKEKRAFRKMGMSDPLQQAYYEGQAAAMYSPRMPQRLRTNPYKPGKRYDAWQHGYDNADPMGEHMGRNY